MVAPLTLTPIAVISSDFPTKFGVPRQSGLVAELEATVHFLPPFNGEDYVRGLQAFSHIWLLWGFEVDGRECGATVRPPRLGGNVRVGVFASRSPYRPNPIGLSSVRLLGIEKDKNLAPVLRVSGADLKDGTVIYDIKPYLSYTDSHQDAVCGFAAEKLGYALKVSCPPQLLASFSVEKQTALLQVLSQDPRPSYQEDPGRVYGFGFAGFEVKFSVDNGTLTVLDIVPN